MSSGDGGPATPNRLLHAGLPFHRTGWIGRHAGQATSVVAAFNALTTAQQAQVIAFLKSL